MEFVLICKVFCDEVLEVFIVTRWFGFFKTFVVDTDFVFVSEYFCFDIVDVFGVVYYVFLKFEEFVFVVFIVFIVVCQLFVI